MLPRRVIFGRLADYFTSQGFRPVDESLEEGFIRFKSGREELILRVVDDASSKDELLSVVIQSAFDTAAGKVSYLALPVEMISKIGDYAFRIHRIGVLVYDEHSVVELVGGRGGGRRMRGGETALDEARIETMLNSLSSRIAKLEEAVAALDAVEELRRRVEALERMYDQLLRSGVRVEEPKSRDTTMEKPGEAAVKQQTPPRGRKKEELPSFLQDNPWVSLLSEKR